MKFQPHFLSIGTLPIVSLLLIILSAAHGPVCATELQAQSEAERFVSATVQKGGYAVLDHLPEGKRELSAAFIAKLLTSADARLKGNGVSIRGAVITGGLDLTDQQIRYDVSMYDCTFTGDVEFNGSRFAGRLDLRESKFKQSVYFANATIALDLIVDHCKFASDVYFEGIRVGRGFRMYHSTFETDYTSFAGATVAEFFTADESTFISHWVSFDKMRVDGNFSARHCTFRYDPASFPERKKEGGPGAQVGFEGAHFADLFLNDSSFENISTIDFTRMQADLISFDGVKSATPSEVKLQRMSFKILSPVNAGQLEFLLAHFNPEFYTDLETSWRTHGYPDEADKIFIAKKIAERQRDCSHFFSQCDSRWAWASSYFHDKLAGYGKRLQRLLYWSLGFLLIGVLVFRSEKDMRIKDPKDAPHYAGRYNAFWYSLDLFLPIIKLGEADVWTPKDDRRWANLYRKVHIIIGSLFVPIGLAAWTGIIK